MSCHVHLIVAPRWYEALGRDAADYFENVRGVTKREQVRGLPPPTLPFMRPLGYR